MSKHLRDKYVRGGDTYGQWLQRQAGPRNDAPIEPAEANPDVLAGLTHEPTAAEEALRRLLDDVKTRQAFLTPVQEVVFFSCFVDGRTESNVSEAFKLSRKGIRHAKHAIRIAIKKLASRIETGRL